MGKRASRTGNLGHDASDSAEHFATCISQGKVLLALMQFFRAQQCFPMTCIMLGHAAPYTGVISISSWLLTQSSREERILHAVLLLSVMLQDTV